jgi:hypothetical protein
MSLPVVSTSTPLHLAIPLETPDALHAGAAVGSFVKPDVMRPASTKEKS